jgi:hypothetical protein
MTTRLSTTVNEACSDPSKVREIDFQGEFFRSRGCHFVAPSPQRPPVLWQAGSSEPGLVLGTVGWQRLPIIFLCFIAVVLCVIYSAACRLAPDDQVESLMRRADVPAAVAAQIMLIAITMSGNLKQQRLPCPDFYDVPYDPWLRLYWATYGAILAYLLVFLVRLLWVLRRDPRSQRGADLLLIAAAAGIPGPLTLVADALAAPSPHHLSLWAWFLACAPASLAAYACAASWRSRLRTFRDNDGDSWGKTPQPPQPAF